MKNNNPSGRQLRFATFGQRLMGSLVFIVIAGMIWVAWSGRYDAEINQFAGWLRSQWQAVVN
jgi:hypothetical protein